MLGTNLYEGIRRVQLKITPRMILQKKYLPVTSSRYVNSEQFHVVKITRHVRLGAVEVKLDAKNNYYYHP